MSHQSEEDTSFDFTLGSDAKFKGYYFIDNPVPVRLTYHKAQISAGYATTFQIPEHVSSEKKSGLWNAGYNVGSQIRTDALKLVHVTTGDALQYQIIPNTPFWKEDIFNPKRMGGFTTAFFAGMLQGVHPPHDIRCQNSEGTKKASVGFHELDLQDGTKNCILDFNITVDVIPTKQFLCNICEEAKVSVPVDVPKFQMSVRCNLNYIHNHRTGHTVALFKIVNHRFFGIP